MAIYHFTAKVIRRSHGRSAVAAAAYRSASEFIDQRQGQSFDYSDKSGVIYSEILLPEGAPEWMCDRERLWNAVEAGELRHDAQVAREVEFALPEELKDFEAIGLAREFVEREFIARGMVADLNVHWDEGNPHAHVMLTMREVTPEGFGQKVREWNQVGLLREWREHWADLANQHLLRAGYDVHVDHRSFKDQGIELEPTSHLGKAVDEMRERGEYAERFRQLEAVRERNAQRIEQKPEIVFDNLTRRQSTFTRRDMAREIFRYVDDGERFRILMARLEGSPELVRLAAAVKDERGNVVEPERFTTREMLAVESRMAERAQEMADTRMHGVGEGTREAALNRHSYLSAEQQEAVHFITSDKSIEALTGFAGAGKSAAIAAARDAWQGEGYRVLGGALSGIAAENLQRESGIESRTLASWEKAWDAGRERLGRRDVLVIDEAGMVGSRQLERIISEAADRGAKVVLVGDAEQLQPIEAGAAFRAIAERVGYQELSGIRRQREAWQREASGDFARGAPGKAFDRYQEHGTIHFSENRTRAKEELVGSWAEHRAAQGVKKREKAALILAHTRTDVRELNLQARAILKERGELGKESRVEVARELSADDGTISIERGERHFAQGERVMFLKNDRELGVKNGSLGTVAAVNKDSMRVVLDGAARREVSFQLKDYGALDYGYAATVHKAQGATVDRTFILATPGMDRHLSYVAMTRHRDGVEMYAGRDDFKGFDELKEKLSRARPKDSTLDYAQRRGMEAARDQRTEQRPSVQRQQERTQRPERETKEPGRERKPEAGQGDPVARFKQAQKEFIQVAGLADFDPKAKVHSAELREEMKQASQEIAKDPAHMRTAEREGFAPQVRNFVRQAEKERGREKSRHLGKDRDFDMER
ncbi:MAG: Ti-type conjugative transfer relaxase TraA [Deltaproteobacteria bacterium]|nr:Ti-type conjugative transfer relaxase TraA [Deltaproteobacteria bacterium]